MTPTEVMRQAAVIRAAIDMAYASRNAAPSPNDDAVALDAIHGAVGLLTGLCANVAAIRQHLDTKADDLK